MSAAENEPDYGSPARWGPCIREEIRIDKPDPAWEAVLAATEGQVNSGVVALPLTPFSAAEPDMEALEALQAELQSTGGIVHTRIEGDKLVIWYDWLYLRRKVFEQPGDRMKGVAALSHAYAPFGAVPAFDYPKYNAEEHEAVMHQAHLDATKAHTIVPGGLLAGPAGPCGPGTGWGVPYVEEESTVQPSMAPDLLPPTD